ncbi:hypothetical protein AQUSIP_09530 [Aquicella siphonis]|uniref:Outer membrane protein beta-barrel domain-containing protein n=1 Tax=Aquicella siphonis TaxID=254247 RepID=A0A5E4PH30_9COXI|nr:outer membrane beta-barrel protein [Aquicella siphonis]VVC75663.1 hypothetical protein AQUSIP_09530 [Aquicella siphonis]
MKHPRLSAIFVAVSAASLLMVSTTGFAAHKSSHKATKMVAEQENFKGEANFKAEVPPPCPPVMMLHDGFYVGVGVGYDSYRIHQSSNVDFVDVASNSVLDSSSLALNHSATGWMGGLFAGYGRYFDWFYLGAELNANTSNADTTWTSSTTVGDPDSSYYAKMKARTSYGVALLPGIKVNDSSLFYARLGYLRSNFKVTETYTNVFDANTATTRSSSDWRNGFNYGVGIETYVAENVSVRGEFTHTSFNSTSVSQSITSADNTTRLASNSKFKPSNNEYMLSLLYHFA